MRSTRTARDRIDLRRPVNRDHPLNVGRVAWWKCVPGRYGGQYWWDLVGGLVAAKSGTFNANNGFRPQTYPGGGGSFLTVSSGGGDLLVSSSAELLMLQVPMTLTGWMCGNAFGGALLGQYLNTFDNQLVKLVRTDSGHITYFASISSGGFQSASNSTTLSTEVWYFWSVVVSGSIASPTWKIGVNAVQQSGSLSALSSTPDTSVNVRLSGDDFGDVFQGYQDDISVWNRALSNAEIEATYILSQQGYPGVLNRVNPATWFTASAAPTFGPLRNKVFLPPIHPSVFQ